MGGCGPRRRAIVLANVTWIKPGPVATRARGAKIPAMKTFSITKRIDAVTGIPERYLAAELPAPRAVKIELTSQCNYRCGFCAHRLRLKDRGEMDRAFYERVVGEMVDAGVEELGMFYIGESFMCDWLPEAIAHAKQRGIGYVFLTTNGSLASPGRVQACMKAGLDSLKFSINQADAEQFVEIAAVKARYFSDAIANLRMARVVRDRGGFDCGLYASSIRYDGAQQVRMQALVDEIRPHVDEHYWLPLYGQAGLTSGAKGTRPTAGNQGRVGALRKPLPCWSLFTEGHITFDGHLSACCFDHDGRFNMGDLNTLSFMEAWHSEPFRRLRRANLTEGVAGTVCEKCLAYDECESKPQPVTLMRRAEGAPM